MRTLRPALLALVAGLLVGCSSTDQSENAGVTNPGPVVMVSGFLKDYSQLKPSPLHEGTWYDMSRSLRGYTGIIIETPIMHDNAYTNEGPDQATALALIEKLRSEMANSLGQQYTLASEPGPKVAVLRMAITKVERSRSHDLRTRRIGGASGELEIVDSRTGARLLGAVETDYASDPYASKALDPYHDAKATFIHWSARLLGALRRVDELATRP